jgi:radical SAM protein with 4Fe4S-binding SPASM domain
MKYLNHNPIFVDWAITTKCNLNCTHCRYFSNSKGKGQKAKKELNSEQVQELAININKSNPNWILIEGGEPFLRKDLFEIIKTLKLQKGTNSTKCHPEHREGSREILRFAQNDNKPCPIYIITSGHGFNEDLAKKCKSNGVKLMISLDSAIKKTYEKIRKGAHFNDAINAIKIANKYNVLDSINYTLQELNTSSKEIQAIGKLAQRYKIKAINFLGYKPNTCTTSKTAIPDFSKVFTDIINIQKKYGLNVMVDEPFFKPWLKKQKIYEPRMDTDKHGFGKKKNQLNPSNQWLQNNGPIVVEDKSGCIFGEYIFIEPDGTIKPCSFAPLSIKQIGKQTIKKIQNKRNRKGKCAKCEYLLQCGGCRVRTYVMTKDWFESDPFCPL